MLYFSLIFYAMLRCKLHLSQTLWLISSLPAGRQAPAGAIKGCDRASTLLELRVLPFMLRRLHRRLQSEGLANPSLIHGPIPCSFYIGIQYISLISLNIYLHLRLIDILKQGDFDSTRIPCQRLFVVLANRPVLENARQVSRHIRLCTTSTLSLISHGIHVGVPDRSFRNGALVVSQELLQMVFLSYVGICILG